MSLIARSDPCGRVWIEDEEHGREPPRMFYVSFPQHFKQRDVEATLALARKMAAADEMLDALKGCIEAMERNNVGNSVPGMNRIIAAKQAIEKAESGT